MGKEEALKREEEGERGRGGERSGYMKLSESFQSGSAVICKLATIDVVITSQ